MILIWSDRSAETGRSTVERCLSLSTTFVRRPAASSGCMRSRPRMRTVTFTLLAGLEELFHSSNFEVHVVIARERSKADFLDFTGLLVFSVFPVFPVLLVLEFAVVEDLCDGRALSWGDLHEIQPPFARHSQSLVCRHRSDRDVLIVDQMNLPNMDPLVYSKFPDYP